MPGSTRASPTVLEPAEAIDRALDDPRLLALLAALQLPQRECPDDPVRPCRPIRGKWGSSTWASRRSSTSSSSTPRLASSSAWIERDWDFAKEGNP
jgi:hypothetical protein